MCTTPPTICLVTVVTRTAAFPATGGHTRGGLSPSDGSTGCHGNPGPSAPRLSHIGALYSETSWKCAVFGVFLGTTVVAFRGMCGIFLCCLWVSVTSHNYKLTEGNTDTQTYTYIDTDRAHFLETQLTSLAAM